MKKQKPRRNALGRKQIRIQELLKALNVAGGENEVDMLAGMMRARLILMPPQVAEVYRNLARRDDLTVGEKAKLNMLEDTYTPSRQQIQAAIPEIQAEHEAKFKGSLEADLAAQSQICVDMIRQTLSPEELDGFNAAATAADGPVSRGRPDPGIVFERLVRLYLPRVDRDRLDRVLHENGVSERHIAARYQTGIGRRSAA